MMPKLLSLVGGLILFGSWVAQTTLYDRWNDKAGSMDRAESVYIVTLSAVFVIQSVPHSVGDGNVTLFRLGLDYMIRGLPSDAQADWRRRLLQTNDDDINNFGIQLMEYIDREKTSLERWKAGFLWLFIALYIAGSVLLILGQYGEFAGLSHSGA
jgi:hypothetical protein